MSDDVGILAFGAYVPRKRLQRSAIFAANGWFDPNLKGGAKGERSIADWDEDSITMAVEAARDALTGTDRALVGSLSLASTTLPFADRLNVGIVKEALNLRDEVGAHDVTGSQRAATSALIEALAAASAKPDPHLCVAAEMRLARPASAAEMSNGDGAAAVLVGAGRPIARLIGTHSVTVDFVDHYRATGQNFDYTWESRWIRDEGYTSILGNAVSAGLARLNVEPGSIDRFVVPISARGVPQALAKQAGIRAEAVQDTLADKVGDTGVAQPLLLLAAALEQAAPGERILLVGFGQGADLLLFETTEALTDRRRGRGVSGSLASRVADENYMRWLFHRGLVELERGIRAENDQKQPGSSLYRSRKAVLGLVGGRCTRTGTVQFPPSEMSVNPNERAAHTQEAYPLAERTARVLTFTADNLTYSPSPPGLYGLVDFDGGGRMIVEFTDVAADDLEVGTEMRMVFRIKAVDELRNFTRYFWKAVPANVSTMQKAS